MNNLQAILFLGGQFGGIASPPFLFFFSLPYTGFNNRLFPFLVFLQDGF